MSIRFNHPSNTITGTDVIKLVVDGGTPTTPRPFRIDSSSVIIPNKQLPVGEAGALVFDTVSKTLKYHNGISWVELVSQDDILAPIKISVTDIYNQLSNRVNTVTYSTSSVPSASVSGTNLNIIFPSAGDSSTDVPGLFTSSPPGSIMQYSLSSGQTVESIREQMSGVSGGQNGRNGTSSAPYVTKTGWCFADGSYWTWNGESGSVTKVVPNLNQNAYLKGIATTGITKTDSVIASSGTIGSTNITFPQHYHGTGMMIGLSGDNGDDGAFIFGKTWNDGNSYTGASIFGDANRGRREQAINGSDTRTALSTTLAMYTGSDTSSHTHTLNNIDVSHFNVAMVYNIAEPSSALNQNSGDRRYVLKSGDIMSGSLTIANSASIQSDDTNLVLWLRNASGGERAAIYHASNTNTLRFRTSGGSEMSLSNVGLLNVASISTGSITGSTLNISESATTGTLNVNGQITATGDIWAFSDERLKENLKPIENAVDIINGIRGVTGNFIGEERTRSMVIAQEVQKNFPYAVTEDDSGFLKVNYDSLIPLLLNAVSILSEEIASLRSSTK